jgi:hypothetical protein
MTLMKKGLLGEPCKREGFPFGDGITAADGRL